MWCLSTWMKTIIACQIFARHLFIAVSSTLLQRGPHNRLGNRQLSFIPLNAPRKLSQYKVGLRPDLSRRNVSPNAGITFPAVDTSKAKDLKIGIISTRWNRDIVNDLLQGTKQGLGEAGVPLSHISLFQVPGAYELPYAAKLLCESKRFDAVVAIGCLIKGETLHFEYISEAVTHGLMKVQIQTMVPVVFGVLTVLDQAQAIARCRKPDNHGESWGSTAVEMALLRKLARNNAGIGGNMSFS